MIGPKHPDNRRGVSLIELLVVIAIIAVLAAVLLPSLRHARQQAKRVACLSNLRQLAHGWHAYFEDHDGAFYQAFNGQYVYGGQQGAASPYYGNLPTFPFARPLNAYLGLPPIAGRFVSTPDGRRRTVDEAAVFHCPSDSGVPGALPSLYEQYGRSYHPNELILGPTRFHYDPRGACAAMYTELQRRRPTLRTEQIDDAARVVLLGDGGWFLEWSPTATAELVWHERPGHHPLTFMDGHAAYLRVARGVHVATDFTVLPHRDLRAWAAQCYEQAQND